MHVTWLHLRWRCVGPRPWLCRPRESGGPRRRSSGPSRGRCRRRRRLSRVRRRRSSRLRSAGVPSSSVYPSQTRNRSSLGSQRSLQTRAMSWASRERRGRTPSPNPRRASGGPRATATRQGLTVGGPGSVASSLFMGPHVKGGASGLGASCTVVPVTSLTCRLLEGTSPDCRAPPLGRGAQGRSCRCSAT